MASRSWPARWCSSPRSHGLLVRARPNVVLRGISDNSMQIRSNVKVIKGRLPQPGTSELMVGNSVVGKYVDTNLGDKLTLARRDWNIVGVFSADGAAFESGDLGRRAATDGRLQPSHLQRRRRATERPFGTRGASSQGGGRSPALERKGLARGHFLRIAIGRDPSFHLFVGHLHRGDLRRGGRDGGGGDDVRAGGRPHSGSGDPARHRLSPSHRAPVFLREAVLLSLAGGIVGTLAATCLSFVTFVTNNQQTFSEVTFHFGFGPEVAVSALLFSLVMGLLGGFTPAWRASRLSIVAATRGAG